MKRRRLPYAQGDGWTIYHGSCHEILPDVGKAAFCLTDPPYSVNYDRSQISRGGSKKVHQAFKEAEIDPTDCLEFLGPLPCDVMAMMYPLDRHILKLAKALKRHGWILRKELVAVKGRFSFWPSAQYQQAHEPILLCTRKGKPLNGKVPANVTTVLEFPVEVKHTEHPTQKPLELWKRLVAYHTEPGDLVIDPFMGSGTAGVAALQLGRRFVGIELEEQYCEVSVRRIRDAQQGGLVGSILRRREPYRGSGLTD